MGYLQQPHVSAGRVPTVLGYHMYISAFLVEATRQRMFTGPMDLPLQYESLPRLFDGVATAVSDRTKKVSFVLSPPMNSDSASYQPRAVQRNSAHAGLYH